ncbi:hypothetical protein [Microbacterium immunditiarum]|uniref:Glycosyl hydrolase family 67 C-terminal domain-containing protein n=1 Tax=Microbacterium immunditiarum TaxID=337480 RepID=A0A7Y9GMH5_9MICO|nr:hypothetical protein [Microbacterium immunditiarum]NYE19201.1 hypothetical protein [Microbacterium immunditiarum]
MTTAVRRGITAVVTVLVLVALGAGIGVAVGDALGIRVQESGRMHPAEPGIAAVAASVPTPSFTTIDAPATPRFDAAIDELTDATADASAAADQLTLAVAAGTAQDEQNDGYTLTIEGSGVRIDAPTEAGGLRGVYDLAAQIRAGRALTDLEGAYEPSRLPFRMVDIGAVGVTADPEEWRPGTNYSHVSEAFRDVYLADAPYIDEDALDDAFDDWDAFLRTSVAQGYNAVAWPGFIEYVDFADAPDGPVYPDDDPHIARAAALREAFGPFWDRAAELGVDVFLRTDMLALTPALDDYLTKRFGGADTENLELWQVYADALDELYEDQPALDGVVIRIGEAGDIYDTPGWDYYSALTVRSVDAVRAMLDVLTAQAESSGTDVIFRTWSVGIGDVGDMHIDPESYEAVLGGIDSDALIVSTKYTAGDFYSWLPLNETLATGDHRRIVEFQSRREFEAFGAFPNDLGPEFQWALNEVLAANPNIEGIWTWTQDGGPWRAGPMSLYLKSGFWQLYEHNARQAAALARDPDADLPQVTADWAREWFSDDSATVQAIAQAMARSRTAIEQGLYLAPFAESRVSALGLEPPPQMWLFEWDILTGDSATLDVIYAIIGPDRIDEAVEGGRVALGAAEQMRDDIEQTDATTWRDPELRGAFLDTIDYEIDTLGMLGAYREMFLAKGEWHDTGSSEAYHRWQNARDDYVARADAHVEAYEGDVDHPAWNLTAAQLGIDRADRDLLVAWGARILLVLALAWLIIGMLSARTRLVRRPGAAAARAAWIASTRPWRARESTLGMLELDRWLLLIIPGGLLVATRALQTSLLSWTHLAIVFGAWLVFLLVVRVCVGSRSPYPAIAAVGGVVVIRCILTLFALSFTGPGGYWFAFWTEPIARVVYIALAFALFVWAFIAAGWAISMQVGARRATGFVVAGVGAALAVTSFAVAIVGLERALTVWNDEMGLLPWGMARILGITTFLEIPESTPWWAAAVGAVVLGVGVVLSLRMSRRGVRQVGEE